MTWDLRGKTVLITGAARGIGAETARRAAAAGANVALVGLEPEELQRVAAQCGSGAAAFECDVTDWRALERAVEGTVERFGGIDVVMANAGIAPAGMVRSVDPAAFERTVEINLLGVWRTVRSSLPQVIERKGYVLVTASLAAAIHGPGMAAYSAAKAGAEAFADSLRTELKHLGVDVGVAYFGFIDTDMVRATDAHPALGALRANAGGPIAKTYPVSQVGKAVVEGMEKRSRWVVVPRWSRALLVLQQDVDNRGVEAASAPVGPGGDAARQREAAGST
jgi:NAD(P)-dependent dehydrogenase (short-subunit alcohol dehydrogenase family)